MAIDITYKGDSLASFGSGTKTMKTAGKYMEDDVTITVPSGSAATPATSVTANPTISVSSGGLITATASATKSVTPSVSEGWVASGTAGTITVSGSNTSQLSTQAAKTVTPTTSEQTAVASGKYTTGAIKVAAIPSNYKDTTNADAVAADVLTGKVFVNGTGEVTGTMANNGAVSKTLDATTNNQTYTVPAGYHNGSGTVSITLETKTATPSTSAQDITPTSGKVLSKVTVNAIPSNYKDVSDTTATADDVLASKVFYTADGTSTTGTIVTKAITDITISGRNVSVPEGYYPGLMIKQIPAGTAGTPTATKGTVSNHSVTVTPSVTNTTGYITGSTKTGTAVTVTASELASGNKAITSSGSTDVVGYSTASVAAGSAGTPEAMIGTISNHTAYVYPFATSTSGYITGETKTGTAVTVTASQLTSGTKSITENGTGIDVTNYKNVDVNVPFPDPPTEKQINFIDYDGTILYSYDYDEWENVASLPDNPSHEDDGLTAQGWNWTKAQIDAQLNAVSDDKIWVGQTYITDDGLTRIYVNLWDGRIHPYLGIGVNGSVVVDWGDNTTSTITGTSLTTVKYANHAYDYGGEYLITLEVTSGSFTFFGVSGTSHILKKDTTTTSNIHRVYSNTIQWIKLGQNVNIGTYAFNYCPSLKFITIPNSITDIGTYAFCYCSSLKSITIPKNVTVINSNDFYNCVSLANISIPSGVTQLKDSAFSYCTSLTSITIPSSVTTLGNNVFSYCYSLKVVNISGNVSSLSTNAFSYCTALERVTLPDTLTTIYSNVFKGCTALNDIIIPYGVETFYSSNYAFSGCISLASIWIPDSVTSLGSPFENCYGMGEYHFESSSPPTIGSDAFKNIQSDCKIYVPQSAVSTYRGASNWSSYSTYIVGE